MRKPFSRELFNENDRKAKTVAAEFLLWLGYRFPYAPVEPMYEAGDFLIWNPATQTRDTVEVERKKVWTVRGRWQGWRTLHVPYRKKDSKAKLFVMVNLHCDTLGFIRMEEILSSHTIFKETIYTDQERFFAVDFRKVDFYTRLGSGWRIVHHIE